MTRIVLAFLFSTLLVACASAADRAQPTLPQSPLVIETAKGKANFIVELANTPESQETGMMFRTHAAPNEGMLFDFGAESERVFWMKNTLIPLDMIFIRANGRIAHIARMTVPKSLRMVPSGAPVQAVLEIAGGRAAQLGVVEGDLVRHSIFKNLP